jgi:NADH-quinone oxidoreductase subunit K
MNFVTIFIIPFSMFFIGLFGIFINRKNILLIIICIELILLSINCIFLMSSFYLDDILGQIFALFILTVAAAESSIGLAILVVYYRLRGTISIQLVNVLRG